MNQKQKHLTLFNQWNEIMNQMEVTPINRKNLNLGIWDQDSLLDKNYSNCFELYDTVGKYMYAKQSKVFKKADADSLVFHRYTNHDKKPIRVSVTASNIERKTKNGKERVFVFPGAREEVVEDMLRKMATEEKRSEAFTFHAPHGQYNVIGFKFSLYSLYKNLREINKSYSYSEIEEALNILHTSNLQFETTEANELKVSSTFLPIMMECEKEASNSKKEYFVCFHALITNLITYGKYRRFRFLDYASYKSPYTRVFFKRLCVNWHQAGPDHNYKINLSTVISSLKAPSKTLAKDKELIEDIMQDLINNNIIKADESTLKPKKEGRKITDWVIKLVATKEFAHQQASNKKVRNNIENQIIIANS